MRSCRRAVGTRRPEPTALGRSRAIPGPCVLPSLVLNPFAFAAPTSHPVNRQPRDNSPLVRLARLEQRSPCFWKENKTGLFHFQKLSTAAIVSLGPHVEHRPARIAGWESTHSVRRVWCCISSASAPSFSVQESCGCQGSLFDDHQRAECQGYTESLRAKDGKSASSLDVVLRTTFGSAVTC